MASFLIPFKLIFIFLFFVSSHALSSSSSSTITSSMEAETLLRWKASLDNTSQTLLSSLWVGSNHCNWTGITCNTTTRSITNITLVDHGLRGTLESLSFFYFPNLIWLKLRNNSLYGHIPSHIGSLSKVEFIDLAYNNFTGNIPSEIDLLTRLSFISLEGNSLGGSIPREIGSLPHLARIYLGRNQLDGPIPREIGMLESLIELNLNNNMLSGQIPSHIGNLSKLNFLDLSLNNLFGNIPSEIGSLKSLSFFSLEANLLFGSIPTEIGMLESLSHLGLRDNMLVGLIPSQIWNLSKLTYLDLSRNNFSGDIPSKISLLKSLSFFSLEANWISGLIPREIGMLESLTQLRLGDNMLSGHIPLHIGNLSKLTYLDLSSNSLTGALPIEIGIWNNATYVDFSRNRFSGAIPNRVCDQNNDLRYLGLSDNQLEGKLPLSFINCSKLITLNLADNKFDDIFPDWLCFLPKLRVLILRSNRFHGSIQDSSATCSFFKLLIVDLSRNDFTGEFPIKLFQNFKTHEEPFEYVKNDSEWYPVKITVRGFEVVYLRIPFFLFIDLSVNGFHGDIPEEVGELRLLGALNVSHNSLTGSIPASLGKLTDLELLDLSFNKLGGRIPSQLTNLTFLEALNFSNNNLVGPIPLGKQFDTFSNDSYIGNLGLCGIPLSKECCQDNAPGSYCLKPKPHHQSFTILVVTLGIGLSIGLLTLIAVAWWLCKLMKRRKKIKLKQKMFERNGGLLFQKKLSSNEGGLDKAKLFTSEELETATDQFNENRILGSGGQGTVYKGMLSDGRIVAIKKSKIANEGYLEQFINEIAILSQIDHRNVVKLLGCCLETEVPLLVYEFIPNGTLSNFIHDQDEEYPRSWDIRLRIAAEVSSAIWYLHSSASVPIYHRDIKSSNILLDEKFRAKVSDFGTSRSVDIDKTHLTTQVRGTFGYLDLEYFRSSQFTEKSDVYSFGVVIAELLTGQKAISTIGPQEIRGLVSYFLSSIEENRVLDIVDPEIVKDDQRDEVVAVAQLAKRCLNLDGRYRPTMKEVAMELERFRTRQGEFIIPIDEPNLSESWDWASSSTEHYTNCSITSTPEPNVHPLMFDTV